MQYRNGNVDHRLIQQIYTAGVHPDRYEELLTSWAARITERVAPDGRSPLDVPEIVTHMRQALAVFEHLGIDAGPSDDGDDPPGMDSPYPVLVCDERGRVHGANPPARDRYGVEKIGELPFEAPALKSIGRAVADMARNPSEEATVILAREGTRGAPAVITVRPYRGGRALVPLVELTSNELTWPDGLDDLLARTFGLSSAECAVVQLMTEGASVVQVAERRGSSVATVRVQVRSIYDKVGVRSQPELIRLAIGFASLFKASRTGISDETREAPSGCHPTDDERRLLSLPDGRRLEYADLGHPAGRPVVFLHDEYYGDCLPAPLIARARAAGLRVVVPVRPFYGRSDGYPPGTNAAEQFSRDLQALVDDLCIDRFTLLARRTGFRFAVNAAHRMTGRVAGLVAVSPELPARSVEDYAHMTALARFIAIANFRNPALLELASRAGMRYLRHVGVRRFARLLNRASPEDLAVLDEPRHWQIISRGITFAVANGNLGYLHDVRHDPVQAWKQTLACPVHMRCLIGARDPHDRMGRAQRCIDAGADLSISTVDGAGQLLFFSHGERVLEEVRAI